MQHSSSGTLPRSCTFARVARVCQFRESHDSVGGGVSFVEALSHARSVYNGDHGEVVTSLNNLGMFFHATGQYVITPRRDAHPCLRFTGVSCECRYDKAGELLQEALSMSIRIYGHGANGSVAACLHNRGVVAKAAGDLSHAVQWLSTAREMRVAVHGDVHGDVASSTLALGQVAQLQGDVDAARSLFARAVDIAHACGARNEEGLALVCLSKLCVVCGLCRRVLCPCPWLVARPDVTLLSRYAGCSACLATLHRSRRRTC